MTRCSASLVIREMQVGPTRRCPFTPTRIAMIGTLGHSTCGEGEEELERPHRPEGVETGVAEEQSGSSSEGK